MQALLTLIFLLVTVCYPRRSDSEISLTPTGQGASIGIKIRNSMWFRSIGASFLAAIVALLPTILFLIYGWATYRTSGHADPTLMAHSQNTEETNIDDGFARGLIVIMMALPTVYIILVAALHFAANLVLTIGVRRKTWFLLTTNAILISGMLIFCFRQGYGLTKGEIKLSLYLLVAAAVSTVPATLYWRTIISRKLKSGQPAEDVTA